MATDRNDSTHEHDDEHLDEQGLPPLDFTTFILSLSTTVLASLGVIPEPDGVRHAVNLPVARQTIDLIVLLQTKTKGNLSGEEERLLNQVLVDLRMRYVEVAGRQSQGK